MHCATTAKERDTIATQLIEEEALSAAAGRTKRAGHFDAEVGVSRHRADEGAVGDVQGTVDGHVKREHFGRPCW